MENPNKNVNRDYMNESYTDSKLSKKTELNETMSINETSQDEYTRKIRNLGGNQ